MPRRRLPPAARLHSPLPPLVACRPPPCRLLLPCASPQQEARKQRRLETMPIPGLSFTDEQLWDGINAALPAWALLLLAPRWRYTMPLVTLTAVAFSALYAATLWGSTQGACVPGGAALCCPAASWHVRCGAPCRRWPCAPTPHLPLSSTCRLPAYLLDWVQTPAWRASLRQTCLVWMAWPACWPSERRCCPPGATAPLLAGSAPAARHGTAGLRASRGC